MKKILHFTCLLFAFIFFQSSQDSKVITTLSAIHPFQIYYVKDNAIDTALLDNDGNMYVTTWDLGDKKSAEFEKAARICEKKIYARMILLKSLDVSDFSEDDIKPSLFKENGQCFISQGYTLKAKNGFSPDKFQLSIFRSHSKSSTYMPVAGNFYILKKQAKYIDVYRHVTQCRAQAYKEGLEVHEEHFDDYTYVSIKPYLDFMKSCLEEKDYQIEGYKE